METVTNNMSEGREQGPASSEGWKTWNAVPRAGPAVFVVETEAFDQGHVRGEWIRLHAEPQVQRRELMELAAVTETGQYAVVDQVGLAVMVPERFTAEEVNDLVRGNGGVFVSDQEQ